MILIKKLNKTQPDSKKVKSYGPVKIYRTRTKKLFESVFFFQFEKTANISWHPHCSLREAASPPLQRKNGERGEGAATPMISSLPAKWRLKNERRNSN